MKRTLLGAVGLLAMSFAFSHGASALELKGNQYNSPTHPTGEGYEKFAEELEKRTDGEITVRNFHGGSLLGAKATLDGVKDDVADVGFVVMPYTPAQLPHGRLIDDLSMVGGDSHAASFAITELYMLECEPCRQEFLNQEQVYLGTASTPPYVLLGSGDLNSLEGLKGLKFRAGGALWSRFTEHLDGVPVNVPSSDQYEGLDRGVIDATIYAIGGLKTHGLADVVEKAVMLPVGTFRSTALFSFNQGRWSDLTDEQREAVLHAAAAGIVRTNTTYVEGDEEGLALAEEEGIPVEEPSEELVQAHKEFVEQDVAATAERAVGEYGIPDAAEFVERFRTLYDKYDAALEGIRKDEAAMTDLIWNEVYSKVDPATYGMN